MKFVIIGAGALGTILAGHLARAGQDVTLVARGKRAAFLKENNLTLTGLADFNIPCKIVEHIGKVKTADVLIVAVKTYDMEGVLADVGHLDVGSVLSVQNGVLKNEQLATVFGEKKVIGAAAFFSGELLPEGAARFTLNSRFCIGEWPQGTSQRVNDIVSVVVDAGINCEVVPQIQSIEWSKFTAWVGMMAPAVLTRVETYKFLSHLQTATLCARMMREVAALANALGIPLEDTPPLPVQTIAAGSEQAAVETLLQLGALMKKNAPAHRVSTLQDLISGKRLEVEGTLGYVITKAAEKGVSVPAVDTCYRLISVIDHTLTGMPAICTHL